MTETSTGAALERPPGFELFFAILEIALHPTQFARIVFAYLCSKFGHYKQLRRDGVTRYFDHPKAAAWIYIDELGGRDPRAIIDILLHDMVEDSYLLSLFRIALNFGSEIAFDIRALTKLPKGKETIEQYLARIVRCGPWAIIAKLCDRLHNLRTLKSSTTEQIQDQITETEQYHLPILIPALMAHGSPWAEHAQALETKIRASLANLKQGQP